VKLTLRAQREIRGAVERKQGDHGDPGEDRVQAEEVEHVAREVAVGVDGDTVEEAGEADPPEQRGSEAADRVRPGPERAPARCLALRAPFERDDADDQEEEDEQQREVEAREHRRVPDRERRERGAARDDQPDLVPVPDRLDRPQRGAPLLVVTRDEREQHPDAEVEAFEQKVPGPEDGDEDEPEGLEVHQ
jgi:hypothetical protein